MSFEFAADWDRVLDVQRRQCGPVPGSAGFEIGTGVYAVDNLASIGPAIGLGSGNFEKVCARYECLVVSGVGEFESERCAAVQPGNLIGNKFAGGAVLVVAV